MKRWDIKRIDDLGKVITGKTPSSDYPDEFGSEYPFITPSDIPNTQKHVYVERFLSEKGMESHKNIKLPTKTTCVVCIGATIGKACMTRSPSFTNQQINSIIANKDNDPDFIYYLASTLRDALISFAGGAATPIVNKSVFSSIKVSVPPKENQKKIAAILSAYDDLIENNNCRIAILERMAEELYREWFVRLRFPGHEKVKIVKGVPEGWEVKELKDVASIVDCLHTKKPIQIDNGEGWLLQLENIKENGRFNNRYKYMISKADYEEWIKNIEVREGDCLITNVGRIAAVAQIPYGVKAALGRNMTAVRPREIPPTFLIQFLLSPHMIEEVLRKQDLGAIMGALNVRAINKLKITIPNKDLLNKFDIIVSPIRNNIWNIIDSSEILKTSRDRLLSRLMSGKINVENMDIQFPASMQEEFAHA